jgi:hypothetical protein
MEGREGIADGTRNDGRPEGKPAYGKMELRNYGWKMKGGRWKEEGGMR